MIGSVTDVSQLEHILLLYPTDNLAFLVPVRRL
jgi:hypothetical protein